MENNKGKIDWRQGYDYGLKHEACTIPNEIANKCICFLRKMRLNFGAFDFIVTPTGEYVFWNVTLMGNGFGLSLLLG